MTNKRVKITWGRTSLLTIDDHGFGVIDEEAETAFTEGQCHALAIALHKLTRWPIKGASHWKDEKGSPNHCVVYWPEQRLYVDIHGAKKRVRTDGGTLVVTHRRVSIKDASNFEYYEKPAVQAAIPFARTILRRLGYVPNSSKG